MATFYGSSWTGTSSGAANRTFRGYVTYTTSETATTYTISVSAIGMQKTGGSECVMVAGTNKSASLTVSGASISSGNPISKLTTSKWSWGDSNPSSKSLGSGTIVINKTTVRQTASVTLKVQKSGGDTSTSWGGTSTGTFTLSIPPKTVSLGYNLNGGSGSVASVSTTYGSAVTVSTVRPIKVGYDFLGWATSASATSAEYAPGGSVTVGAITTLYAVYHASFVQPSITNVKAVRTVSKSSSEAAANGTYGYVMFDYVAPANYKSINLIVRYSGDAQDKSFTSGDTTGSKSTWSINEIPLNESAQIIITASGVTYDDKVFSVTETTFISTQTVVWDAYMSGTLSSFAIGTIANEERSEFENTLPFGAALMNMIYPVGSIYMSTNDVSPQQFFGGTWVRIGVGRTLISAGGGTDPTFETNNYTGRGTYAPTEDGAKNWFTAGQTGGQCDHALTVGELASHTHALSGSVPYNSTGTWSGDSYNGALSGSGAKLVKVQDSGGVGTITATLGSGSGTAHNIMQPYLAVYMWKRTA